MSGTVPPVRIEDVTYSYPAWSDRAGPALRGASLVVDAGLVVVTGDSGSGKSTLLRLLNGLVPHFHGGSLDGRAVVCGLDVARTPTRRLARHVGFVFQDPEAGFVRGTVAKEVAFGPENLGMDPADIRRAVGESLERVGIAHLAGRRLRTLSGGERQRVALASAVAGRPAVLAMDEPTSQLDHAGAAALAAIVDDLVSAGHTVVVAEHRPGSYRAPGRALSIVAGSVAAQDGTTEAGWPVAAPVGLPPVGHTSPAGAPVAWALERATIGMDGRPVIADADLEGTAGEIVAVTGANGAGKTTLLRAIAGLIQPLAGRVRHGPGRVAYLPQEPGVLLHRNSVRAEIEQTLRWSGESGDPGEILTLLGLADHGESDPRDLSGGQRQRAGLAAILAGRPGLALLDEPTRGMDRAARTALAATVNRLAEAGAAVIMATHDDDLAREVAHRVMRIDDGRIHPALDAVVR
ncbi:MAG TPA: ATP-binding cassette domain-containing protein [Acidimicrobiales bacterium]|nr:ATP-binding cassette domain-containing protein [Acidimicrobiales bacterium]